MANSPRFAGTPVEDLPPLPPGFVLEPQAAGPWTKYQQTAQPQQGPWTKYQEPPRGPRFAGIPVGDELPPLPPGFVLETPITDLPGVTSRPDFSGVTATVNGERVGKSGVRESERQAQIAAMDQAVDYEGQLDSLNTQEGIGRALGVGGRAMWRGLAAIPDIVVAPLAAGLNRLTEKGPTTTSLIAGERERYLPKQKTITETGDYLMDLMGAPRPETSQERVSSDLTSALTGTLATMGVGSALQANQLPAAAPTVRNYLAELLTSQPKTQIAATVGGAGASGLARESGATPGQQAAFGLAGGLLPGLGAYGVQATTRGAFRGASGETMQDNINAFRGAGTTPTAGQAAANRRLQGVETFLSSVPGGAGPIAAKAASQAKQVGAQLDDFAGNLSPRGTSITPTQAGNAINKGVTGPQGFLAGSKKVSDQLYDRLDAAIAPDTRVDVGNVSRALSDLNAEIPGAPSLSKLFQNGRIMGIESGLSSDIGGIQGVLSRPGMKAQADALRAGLAQQADAAEQAYTRQVQQVQSANARNASLGMRNNPIPPPPRPAIATQADIDGQVNQWLGSQVDNKLPYEALKKLRTLVGKELENYSIVSDIPRSKWNAVYKALSKDLEEVAGQSPEAKRAWDRANTYYNVRANRIEAIDHVIDKSGGGEKIYNAAFSGIKDGATTLRAVMQSLPADAQKEVAAAFVRRMGKAVASQQNDAGDAFSMSTFLTNWANMSPEAKRVMFDRFGPSYSRSMDHVAKMASNVRDGSKVFANNSGTGPRGALIGSVGAAAGTIFGLLAAGQVGKAALVAGSAVAATGALNGMSRAMANPTFVNWLAMSTKMPISSLPSQVVMLRRIAAHTDDESVAEVADELEQRAGQSPQ